MNPDFPISERVEVRNDAELRDALVAGGPVRLAGIGSQQLSVPAPSAPRPRLVSLAPMDRILRLEADDLTCTVEAGVRRQALDQALAEQRLQLPCAGKGSIGGVFAADLHGPLGTGMYSPRSLLLGFEGLLAEGLSFKAGARVVKSVAGFDLQKLFVGSQGRLFAVTRLHLKLRPAPRHQVNFVQRERDLTLFHRLRLLPTPPTCLLVHKPDAALDDTAGEAASIVVCGTLCGPRPSVEALLHDHGLAADTASVPLAMEPGEHEEILQGTVLCSRLGELLSRLSQQEVTASAGGRFQVRVARQEADEVLASLHDLAPDTRVLRGTAARRGHGIAANRIAANSAAANGAEVAARLQRSLKLALDPNGVLS